MAIPTTTPIRIRYVPRDKAPVELGSGEIDSDGIITVTAPATGQADYLAEVMAELNARDYVILKGPPLPEPPVAAAEEPEEQPDDVEAEEAAPGLIDLVQPGAAAEAQPRPGPSKTKVRRGAPDFLAALKDYGLRVFALDLDFDVTSFDGDDALAVDASDITPAPSSAAPISGPPD